MPYADVVPICFRAIASVAVLLKGFAWNAITAWRALWKITANNEYVSSRWQVTRSGPPALLVLGVELRYNGNHEGEAGMHTEFLITPLGGLWRRWEDNTEMDARNIRFKDWICMKMVHDRVQCWALVEGEAQGCDSFHVAAVGDWLEWGKRMLGAHIRLGRKCSSVSWTSVFRYRNCDVAKLVQSNNGYYV
jgi:hypothetical protein